MPKHNIMCTICKEALKSTENICSTNCGHVFHFVCINESQSCPACQHNNPTTHKIYLFFDESKDEKFANNWKDKLKIIELHKQIEDSKSNYLYLHEKYVISQESVRKLEGRIKKSDHSLLQRNVILSDLEDRIKTLEELNEYLTIDNECKTEALTSKADEITRLKNSLVTLAEKNSSVIVLNEQITMLKQTVNEHTILLDREATKCSQLLRDKEKLQNYIDIMNFKKNGKIGTNNDVTNETLSYSTKKRITKVACDFDSLKSADEGERNNTDSTALRSADNNRPHRIYAPNIVPSFTGFSILNGHPFNNYFSKMIIKNQQAKLKTLRISKHQITTCAKVKQIFQKLRHKSLIYSTVFIFLFLISNVTSVD